MAMTNKLAKYEERLQGSNEFAIATILDPQLQLKYIPDGYYVAYKPITLSSFVYIHIDGYYVAW